MSKRILSLALLICLFTTALAACGGGDKSGASAGDAKRGKELYNKTVIGPNAAPGCVTCHSLEPGKTLVGPSHAGIATIAATAVPGMSAEEFLKQSIVDPNANVTEGFSSGIMYPNYAKDLTEQEINDIVAYLLTIK